MPATPKKLLTPDEVADLNEKFRDTEGDESEEGRREHARTRSKLRRLSHMESCPVCQREVELRGDCLVEVDVPLDSCKKPIAINGKEYFGNIRVNACVAQLLLYTIDQNRQGMLRDTQGTDHTPVFMGQLHERARQVQDA